MWIGVLVEPDFRRPDCVEGFAVLPGIRENTDVSDSHSNGERVLSCFFEFLGSSGLK
jgi:hypothetical protein